MKKITLAVVCLLGLKMNIVFGQAGILDNTFSGDGKAMTSLSIAPDFLYQTSSTIQSDGKIILVGYVSHSPQRFILVRYNSDGTLDNGFGNAGIVTTIFDNSATVLPRDIVLETGGKILIAGYFGTGTDYHSGCMRYNANGTIDSTFGNDGLVTTNFGGYEDEARSIALQTDGKIVTAGIYRPGVTTGVDFSAVRYNPDGTPDSSFNGIGRVITDVDSSSKDFGNSMVIQQDGKIVVAGYSYKNTGDPAYFALIRYNADGTLDSSFDFDGKLVVSVDSMEGNCSSIALQSDEKILMAGRGNSYLLLRRFNSDGIPDSSFDYDGAVVVSDSTINGSMGLLAVQPDGRILAGGGSVNSQSDFVLLRFNSNGSPDNTFGIGGKVLTDFGGLEFANRVMLQQDGKIVAVGSSLIDTVYSFAIARYLNNLDMGILNFTNSNSLFIYPNPIQSTAELSYTLQQDETFTLALLDVNGKEVQTFFTNQSKTKGEHQEQLQLNASLAAGNYILTLTNAQQKIAGIKIVKQ